MAGGKLSLWRLMVVVLVAAAGLVLLASYALHPISPRATANTALIGIGLSVLGAWSAVRLWLAKHSGADATAPTREQVVKAQRDLAYELRELWKEEIEIRQLHEPDALPVHWKLSELRVMDHAKNIFRPDQLTSADICFDGRTDEDGIKAMAAWFRNLAKQRLVILGDAGMGKTTLAMLLMLQLLKPPEPERLDSAERERVPVLLTLSGSGWHSGSKLRQWLGQRLGETYPKFRAYGPELVKQGKILPVLDGLDELAPRLRPHLLEQVRAHRDPLILTCRTAEYLATVKGPDGKVLTGAAVIEPMPLQAAEIADYLERVPRERPDEWADLFVTLRSCPDHPITQALTTPLDLWLLRKTYIDPGRDPAGLLDTGRYPTQYAITKHLLDNLVCALLDREARPPDADGKHPFWPRHSPEPADASKWLVFLAEHVQAGDGQDLDWWQLNHSLATCRPRFVARVVSKTGPGYGLVYGLGLMLVILLADYVAGVHGAGLVRTLVVLLAAGVLGAMLGLVGRKRESIARGAGNFIDVVTNLKTKPSYASFRFSFRGHVRSSLPRGLRFLLAAFRVGIIIGLGGGIIGVPTGAFLWWERSHIHWHAAGLTASILLGCALGFGSFFLAGFLSMSMNFLTYSATTPLTDDQPQTPAITLHGDLQLTCIRWLAVGLPFAVATAPVVAVIALAYGFRGAIVCAILFTLLPAGWGLFWVKDRASAVYLVTVGILRLERRVPRRLMAFLDDAHRVGLLRQVGATYQFRHITLTDHFAPPSPQQLIDRHAPAFSQARRGRGDLAAAIAVLEGLLADQLRVLGPDHLSTLVTWHEVARMMAERGDHAALAKYREVLAAELRVLGPDHPSTLASSNVVNYLVAHRNP